MQLFKFVFSCSPQRVGAGKRPVISDNSGRLVLPPPANSGKQTSTSARRRRAALPLLTPVHSARPPPRDAPLPSGSGRSSSLAATALDALLRDQKREVPPGARPTLATCLSGRRKPHAGRGLPPEKRGRLPVPPPPGAGWAG